MKETTCSDNELHDLIVPTVEEQYNEDDHYGVQRPADELLEEDNQQLNFWGKW